MHLLNISATIDNLRLILSNPLLVIIKLSKKGVTKLLMLSEIHDIETSITVRNGFEPVHKSHKRSL